MKVIRRFKSSKEYCLMLYLMCICINMEAQGLDSAHSDILAEYDSNYLAVFPNKLTARVYLSRKFTNLVIEDEPINSELRYEPNSTVNLGIGATYKGFTLNLAYGFAFLNQNESKGETSYLDLQSHIYKRRYALDIFAQFYQGLYLENTKNLFSAFPDRYYRRPDINISIIGAGYNRVFNSQKFSYAAAYLQNEYQKKSAGSLLLGGKILLLSERSDSSIIPYWEAENDFRSFHNTKSIGGVLIGPGGGYAHTLVFDQHLFLTLSLELNLLFGHLTFLSDDDTNVAYWQLSPSTDLRIATGYNSRRTYIGLNLVLDQSVIYRQNRELIATFGIGNIRLNYAKRFDISKKWIKRLSKVGL